MDFVLLQPRVHGPYVNSFNPIIPLIVAISHPIYRYETETVDREGVLLARRLSCELERGASSVECIPKGHPPRTVSG